MKKQASVSHKSFCMKTFVWLSDLLTALCQSDAASKQLTLMIDRWQRNSLLHHCALCHLQNFFFFMPRTTLRTCWKTISPAKQVIRTTRKSRLLGLNIGIMHRGVIRSSHRRIPRDWSPACDMAVKTLTDCFTNTCTCTHTHTQTRSCMHARKITLTDCFTNSIGLTDTYSPGYPPSSLLYEVNTI